MTTPILLIHAFPVDRRMWLPVAEQLSDAGFDVEAIDMRGFGSDQRELVGEPTLDVLADDVADRIRSLGAGPVILGGVSLGGYVAMNLAARYPQLLAGLILANTKSEADDEAGREVRHGFANRVDADGVAWIPDAMIAKLLGETTRASSPEVVAAVRKQIVMNRPETIAWVQRAMANRPDTSAALAALTIPVLVLASDEDAIASRQNAEHLAAITSGRLVHIESAGHLSVFEQPDTAGRVILSWLQTSETN